MVAGSRGARGSVTGRGTVSCGLTMIHRVGRDATGGRDLLTEGPRLLHSATPFPILYDGPRAGTVCVPQPTIGQYLAEPAPPQDPPPPRSQPPVRLTSGPDATTSGSPTGTTGGSASGGSLRGGSNSGGMGPQTGQSGTSDSSTMGSKSNPGDTRSGTGTMSRGDQSNGQSMSKSSSKVREVQEALKSEGHDPGPIDGVMGPRTQQALRQYQRQENLNETGRLDQETLNKLGV